MADKIIHAKDCKCVVCGKQAEAFWPCIDPDIPSHPYCRKCLDKEKAKLFIEIHKIDEKYNKQKGQQQ